MTGQRAPGYCSFWCQPSKVQPSRVNVGTSEHMRSLLRHERDVASLRAAILVGSTGERLPMDDAYFAVLRADITEPTNL